jgi:hypothetical protein
MGHGNPQTVRRWYIRDLSKLLDASEETTRRVLVPTLIERGAIARHGRLLYARQVDIERAILSSTNEAA